MPTEETRQKPCVYKVARWNQEPAPFDLQEALQKALWGKAKQIKKRIRYTGPGGDTALLIDYREDHQGGIFGSFVNYTKGVAAQVLEINPEAEALTYKEVKPGKTPTNEEREFLEGILFFFLKKNHLILIPSRALTPQYFEEYLNWLLTSVGLMGDGQSLLLSNRAPLQKAQKIKQATGICFSSGLEYEARAPGANEATKTRARFIPTGATWEALKQFLATLGRDSVDWPTELEQEGLTDAADVKMDVFLHWKRKKNENDFELMDRVANSFRHADETVDYKIIVPGGQVTKDDFVLRKVKSIKCRNGLPNRSDARTKMAQWLVDLISSNQVLS